MDSEFDNISNMNITSNLNKSEQLPDLSMKSLKKIKNDEYYNLDLEIKQEVQIEKKSDQHLDLDLITDSVNSNLSSHKSKDTNQRDIYEFKSLEEQI